MAQPDKLSTYLASLGVKRYPPRLSPFDPGYDPRTLESHLDQSAHLIDVLKISMACWLIAGEDATRAKFAAARRAGVPTTTGGGPFEIAVARGRRDEFLDLVADVGATRIEAGQGFTAIELDPAETVAAAGARGLEVQYELGGKHSGAFSDETVDSLRRIGAAWLDAGAKQLVVEARESAQDVGLFDEGGALQTRFADALVDEFGFDALVFEAPNKSSQFALLRHLGPEVRLCNVRLEEILRVEIFRRGLHSDSFSEPKLTPGT